MRAPALSEPNTTFPTYQVPQVSAMRGSAPPVQVARVARGMGAEPPGTARRAAVDDGHASSVINGSSCRTSLKSPGNYNLKMQSVTDYCLLNTVTVPNKQRKDRATVTHNNSSKLDCKFGALLIGQDIPNQKSDDLEDVDLNANKMNLTCTDANDDSNNNHNNIDTSIHRDDTYTLERLIELSQWTRRLEREGHALPMLRLCGGGESSLSTGTTGWGTPPSQQASNNNGRSKRHRTQLFSCGSHGPGVGVIAGTSTSGWGTANPANPNNTGTQNWNNNSNRAQNSSQGPTPQDGKW